MSKGRPRTLSGRPCLRSSPVRLSASNRPNRYETGGESSWVISVAWRFEDSNANEMGQQQTLQQ